MDPRITRLWDAQNRVTMVGVTYRKGGRVVLVTVRRDSNPLIGGWIVQTGVWRGWVPNLRRALTIGKIWASCRIADVPDGTL